MKSLILGLLLLSSQLSAQSVDLLQQLYGRSNAKLPKRQEIAEVNGPESVVLSFHASQSVARERIFLSDLAACRGSKKACDAILSVDLGPAPMPMRQDKIPRQRIEDIVQREEANVNVVWEGPEYCQVTALSSPVNEGSVLRLLEREFQSAPPGMRVLVQSIRLPSMQILRHNNYSFRLGGTSEQISRVYSHPRTRFTQIKIVAVDQDPASQSTIEFIAQVNLRVEIQALVLRLSRERGERLHADHVETQWIPFQDQVVSDEKVILGKLLRSRLTANQPIRSWDLVREPEVQRGERVEAIINSGGVKMNSIAQALEPGFIGQKIRIRLEATKKNMLGIVIARSQVEVHSL